MAFAEVSDPADFPGTGRDFSAGRSVSRRLMIETAEYGDGRLSVRWA
jgi:hypothetical protein